MVGGKAVGRDRSRFLSASPDLIRAKSSLQRVGTNADFCLHQELASLVSKGGPRISSREKVQGMGTEGSA